MGITKIFSADLSMNMPGFAMLLYDDIERTVKIDRVSHVNNKKSTLNHGQKLRETAKEIRTYIEQDPDVLVREQAIGGNPAKTLVALAKVVGLTDYLAQIFIGSEFVEIFPTTIKRLLTGDQHAQKNDVANALRRWVGDYEYRTDDESDAVAVGIAWLIKNGYIDGLPEEDRKVKIKINKKERK